MKTTKQKHNKALQGLSLGLVAAFCVSATVVANERDRYTNDYNYGNSGNSGEFEYARVVDVQPVLDVYQVNEPVRQCYQERVPRSRYSSYEGKQSRTPEIFGAIIGAAVGNQFGAGRGQDIATVAGAVLGGSLGRDVKNNSRRSQQRYDGYGAGSRCELSNGYRNEQRIVGYDVSYSYNGRIYQTRMGHDPGDSIRVKVSVQPG